MDKKEYIKSVAEINFAYSQKLAMDKTLSRHEKIGFPDEYREGFSAAIFDDILGKLPALNGTNKKIADVGCGCDDLVTLMIAKATANKNNLYLLDGQEMLKLVTTDSKFIHKIAGRFPDDLDFINKHQGSFDAIVVYSAMHYVTLDMNPLTFIDYLTVLLAPGGRLLLGDLANRSKRRRFFLSPSGIKTHQKYTNSDEIPKVDLQELDIGKIDDTLIMTVLTRYRNAGMETYLLPQNENLPMANRREDILIVKRD